MKLRMGEWGWGASCVLFFCLSSLATASETIAFVRDDGRLFLGCDDVAQALELEFKVVTPGRLVTFCRAGAQEFCIPVRLTPAMLRQMGEDLLIDAVVLEPALRFRAHAVDDQVTLTRLATPAADVDGKPPAYNAAWASGRGFGRGDVLPDIPLIDMEGKEVRFSEFLGKRYILYCWASW